MKENPITPELLKDISSTLEIKQTTDEVCREKIILLIKITNLILENEDYNQKLYPYFLKYHQNPSIKIQNLIKNIKESETIDQFYLDSLLLIFIQLLREILLTLMRKYNKNNHVIYKKIDTYKKIYKEFSYKFHSNEKIILTCQADLNYIRHHLDTDILNFYLEREGFYNFQQTAKNAENNTKALQANVEKINLELTKIEEKLKKSQDELDNYRQGINFVLLNKGFSHLLKKKENSKSCMFLLLFFTGFSIMIMPFCKIISEKNWAGITWQELLVGISLEFVLIYFFRVILNQYRANETQIMQLELRQTLCQFIEDYIKFSRKNKVNDNGEKDTDALDKFENLIFSSILSNDNNIPSTFDGMEQVTQLIKELKSKP